MSVDFFIATHSSSKQPLFGLYDEPDPAKEPAYILENRESEWIGIVRNPREIPVDFYGLDDSLIILKVAAADTRPQKESICDGMIHHENNLTFVELKTREGSGWLGKATSQLINTVKLFATHHPLNNYDRVQAFVCNSMRPSATQNHAIQLQRFKTETAALNFKGKNAGLDMDVKREIIV